MSSFKTHIQLPRQQYKDLLVQLMNCKYYKKRENDWIDPSKPSLWAHEFYAQKYKLPAEKAIILLELGNFFYPKLIPLL